MDFFIFFVLLVIIFNGPLIFLCYLLYKRNQTLRKQLFQMLNPDEENIFD